MNTDINETKNIALIDHDRILYNELKEQEGFKPNYYWHHFKNLEIFNQMVQPNGFDLVIFNEPDSKAKKIGKFSGSFLKLIHIPVIVLFSKGGRKDYDSGQVNMESLSFIEKPFRFFKLAQSINEKFELQEKSRALSVMIGPYFLKPFEKVLLDNFGEELKLTDTEVKILKILSMYEGDFVRRELVMEKVWGIKKFLETHTLETHIYRLRKKIQKKFSENLCIKSEKGKYALEYKS